MKFKLSIITVTYNNFHELLATYKSIEHLLSSEVQWIVVDGGKDSNTIDFCDSLNHKSVLIIRGKDKGIYDGMNIGIENSSGEFLWFLNSGDISFIKSVEEINFDNFEDLNIYNIRALNQEMNPLKWKGLSQNIYNLKIYPCVPHQSTIFRKELFKKFNGYSLEYKIVSDYDKYCHFFVNQVKFKYYPETVLAGFVYTGISSDFKNSLKILREIKLIQLKYFGSLHIKTRLYYSSRFLISVFVPRRVLTGLRAIIFKTY